MFPLATATARSRRWWPGALSIALGVPGGALAVAIAIELERRHAGTPWVRLAVAIVGAAAMSGAGRLLAAACASLVDSSSIPPGNDEESRPFRPAPPSSAWQALDDDPPADGWYRFRAELQRTLALHARRQAPFSLLLIEIVESGDSFPDGRGRLAQAEASVALHLRAALRETDLSMQIRPGTFAALLPDVGDSDAASGVCGRLEQSIGSARWCDSSEMGFRLASAHFPEQGSDSGRLFEAAEAALEAAAMFNHSRFAMPRAA